MVTGNDPIIMEYLTKIFKQDEEAYNTLVASPMEATRQKVVSAYDLITSRKTIKRPTSLELEKEGTNSGIVEIFNHLVNTADIGTAPYYLRVEKTNLECSEMYFRCMRAVFLIGTKTNPEQADACRKIGEQLIVGKLKNIDEKRTIENIKNYTSDNYYYSKLSSEIVKLMKGKS